MLQLLIRSSICVLLSTAVFLPPEHAQAQTASRGSGSIYTFGGHLIIQGTDQHDRAKVQDRRDKLRIKLNRKTYTFSRSGISRIVFCGEAGNDSFDNYSSIPTTAYGDGGNDRLHSRFSEAEFDGGDGDDTLIGSPMNDSLYGGSHDDTVFGNEGDDDIFTDQNLFTGTTVVVAFTDSDNMGSGQRYVQYSSIQGEDVAFGGSGADLIVTGGKYDLVFAGAGDDFVSTQGGDDIAYGQSGNDHLRGDNGNDLLNGGSDNDRLLGGDGNDKIFGMSGRDTIEAGSGNDFANGGSSNDLLCGEDGNDRLFGMSGDDRLIGGDGLDTLNGGSGNNVEIQGASGECPNDLDDDFNDDDENFFDDNVPS